VREQREGWLGAGKRCCCLGPGAPVFFISERTRFTKQKYYVLGVTVRAYCWFHPAAKQYQRNVGCVIAMTQALGAFMTNCHENKPSMSALPEA
jgi:hypothetical protein